MATNIYVATLSKPLKVDPALPGCGTAGVMQIYVIASSYAMAEAAILAKYPDVEVKAISHQNYSGSPIVIGD